MTVFAVSSVIVLRWALLLIIAVGALSINERATGATEELR